MNIPTLLLPMADKVRAQAFALDLAVDITLAVAPISSAAIHA